MSDLYRQLTISILSADTPLDLQKRLDHFQKTQTEDFTQMMLCVRKDKVIALSAFLFSMLPSEIKNLDSSDKAFDVQEVHGSIRVRSGSTTSLEDLQRTLSSTSALAIPA